MSFHEHNLEIVGFFFPPTSQQSSDAILEKRDQKLIWVTHNYSRNDTLTELVFLTLDLFTASYLVPQKTLGVRNMLIAQPEHGWSCPSETETSRSFWLWDDTFTIYLPAKILIKPPWGRILYLPKVLHLSTLSESHPIKQTNSVRCQKITSASAQNAHFPNYEPWFPLDQSVP